MNNILQYTLIFLFSLASGYGLFVIILKLIPQKVKKENLAQKEEVLVEAQKQAIYILESSNTRLNETIQLMSEELEEDIQARTKELEEEEAEFSEQDEFLKNEEERLQKLEEELAKKVAEEQKRAQDLIKKQEEIQKSELNVLKQLEITSQTNASLLKESLKNSMIESRHLEGQKVLKELMLELDSSAKKRAQRILERAQARYEPKFFWPKAINSIEIATKELGEKLASDQCQLIADMREISGVDITVYIPKDDERNLPSIKLAGGYGIHKEAAKMALTQLIAKGPSSWNQVKQTFDKFNREFDQEAIKLGRDAVNILKLPNIHPEIQKLIGALNWRTSYRQNQWFHTVEVATLAGIIGAELGVDPEASRRVGLLHDIGKAIDYKIEGSHAVISGDYADRYGEKKVICDTVMSHHSDLIVETPLAYILRVADTLSGARPGARVNLEEGYQIRLGAIADAVRSFKGISDMAIMNGGREVHIQVNHKKVKENQLEELAKSIARKIEEDVAFPGQIKVLVSRQFESVTVA